MKITTPREAYDDCIEQAREAARRQRKTAAEKADVVLGHFHTSAAKTLEGFADMLEKMRDIRCQ